MFRGFGFKVFGVLRFWGLGFISGVWGTVEGFILKVSDVLHSGPCVLVCLSVSTPEMGVSESRGP